MLLRGLIEKKCIETIFHSAWHNLSPQSKCNIILIRGREGMNAKNNFRGLAKHKIYRLQCTTWVIRSSVENNNYK